MAQRPTILAAGRLVNGKGDLGPVSAIERKLRDAGCRIDHLFIDPLAKGWDIPFEANHFRSGCGPIEALESACARVMQGQVDAVVIEGTDNLETEYDDKRDERQRLMNIYGDEWPLPKAYTHLAFEFIRLVGTTPAAFKNIAEQLYENYRRTAQRENFYNPPEAKRFEYITELFRAVDCANPSVDFSGRLIIGNKAAADLCVMPNQKRVQVLGVAVEETSGDGLEHVAEIARFDHLRKAYVATCQQAGIPFHERFLEGKALLEAYTCYSVIPMAFFLSSGIAASFDEIGHILERFEVTVTGGMNIGRAPWNNPALNGLICMYEKLSHGAAEFGAVHGNGGLGYKQGVAVLGSL